MFDRATLSNGLRIIGDRRPGYRSVSMGIWVGAGSQYENSDQAGISHFTEHMLFKGTENRSSRDIAETMDAVGGHINAFTSRSCTCYYCRVLGEDMPVAMDVMSDMLLNSTLDDKEIAKEKGVIIAEINMTEDDPEDLISDVAMLARFGDQPISRPIQGTISSVSELTRERVSGFMSSAYAPGNTVLAVAGNYDWSRVIELAEKHLGKWKSGAGLALPATLPYEPQVLIRDKDIEQVHIMVLYNAFPKADRRRTALFLLDGIYGSSASSRLYQSIREKRGLAYSVSSFCDLHSDVGLFGVYAAVNPSNTMEIIDLIRQESEKLLREPVPVQEMEKIRKQYISSTLMAEESISAVMNMIGNRTLDGLELYTPEEAEEKIKRVTIDDISEVAGHVFSAECGIAMVGKASLLPQVTLKR